jgi:NAD(P)H-hydrate epimerase
MKVSNVSQMRRLDQTAIETYGIADELLMENAGLAVFEVLRDRIGICDKQFLIFCGAGNNGGDGFVVARKIHAGGGRVKIVLLGNPEKYQGAARLNWKIVNSLPIEIQPIESVTDIESALGRCDAVVDAVFGTGLTREVGGIYAETIHLINQSRRPVISVDIPSGIHGDTGQVMGIAVKADHTITFGLPKYGNLLYPGADHNGQLFVTHISFPPAIYDTDDMMVEINHPPSLPCRDPAGHKGSFGDALFIAGASSYYGAPYFASQSFLKSGGGYSRLACPSGMVPALAAKASEVVFIPQHMTPPGSIARVNAPELQKIADKVDIVIIGPGLALEKETQALTRLLISTINKPLILDGDGITAICKDPTLLRNRTTPTVLTPHLGEMSRLTGRKIKDIETDPIAILQQTARDLDVMIVLKGAHSLIAFPDNRVYINLSGNNGMATAGSGDVLTGTIAAMHGLGLSFDQAVLKGVFIHGMAGDLAAEDHGPDGMTAQDILACLPRALGMDRNGLPANLKQRYMGAKVL